jgi:hypothetical protein
MTGTHLVKKCYFLRNLLWTCLAWHIFSPSIRLFLAVMDGRCGSMHCPGCLGINLGYTEWLPWYQATWIRCPISQSKRLVCWAYSLQYMEILGFCWHISHLMRAASIHVNHHIHHIAIYKCHPHNPLILPMARIQQFTGVTVLITYLWSPQNNWMTYINSIRKSSLNYGNIWLCNKMDTRSSSPI